MPELTRFTDEEGNCHIRFRNGSELIVKKDQTRIATIIVDENPVLFNRICDLIDNEYGNSVIINKKLNGFGQHLGIVKIKL